MKITASERDCHLLTYALNIQGELTGIEDVVNGKACGCFCPACGEALIAKNKGVKRVHHFAHQSGTECEYGIESMLHILAKEKIREAFLTKNEFWMQFKRKLYCPQKSECRFFVDFDFSGCCRFDTQRVNLKKYYDSCEQEIAYDNVRRRSDLKIFSSITPERPPVYVEFCVTHASDVEKLHSGNRIIEVRIKNEEDISELIEQGFVEAPGVVDKEDHFPYSCFYEFKSKPDSHFTCSREIRYARFTLHRSGKMHWDDESCECSEVDSLRKSYRYSLLEMCAFEDGKDFFNKAKYIAYHRFSIPNCLLCRNWVESYGGWGWICRNYKRLGIAIPEQKAPQRDQTCPFFSVDKAAMTTVLNKNFEKDWIIFEE